MTGPQHYQEAERLADQANHYTYGDGADPVTGAALAAEAQVHATLALAAATAMGLPDLPSGDWDDWSFVASAGHAGRIPGSERAVTP
jgi:hypothetical protein